MSAPPNTPDTATLADLLARATPGPWHAGRSDMMSYDASGTVAFKNVYADDERGGVHLGDPMPLTVAKAVDESALYDGAGAKAIPDAEIMTNAALIALAPALAAEVIRLRAENERLRGALALADKALRPAVVQAAGGPRIAEIGQWFATADDAIGLIEAALAEPQP